MQYGVLFQLFVIANVPMVFCFRHRYDYSSCLLCVLIIGEGLEVSIRTRMLPGSSCVASFAMFV